jgi:fluoroquinolone resistance protein
MDKKYIEDKTFENLNVSEQGIDKGTYEYCTFLQCDFSNADLSHFGFTECVFDGCNLSMAKTSQTTLGAVQFKNSKLLGLRFETCSASLFSVSFEACVLDYASFYKVNLKGTVFKNVLLREVDFTEANLAQAVFDTCDLNRATFDNTILEKADFRTSFHYVINPVMNRVKKARFSSAGIAGLLQAFDIEID